MKWTEQAACRNIEPELFFPVSVEGTDVFARQAARALAVCDRCPVWRDCRDDAIATESGGIRGRMTEQQRRAVGHPVAA